MAPCAHRLQLDFNWDHIVLHFLLSYPGAFIPLPLGTQTQECLSPALHRGNLTITLIMDVYGRWVRLWEW